MSRIISILFCLSALLFASSEASAATSSCTSMFAATGGTSFSVVVQRSCDGAAATTVQTVTGISSSQFYARWAAIVSGEVRAVVLNGYALVSCSWSNSPPVSQCVFTK